MITKYCFPNLHWILVKAFEVEDCEFVPVHHQQVITKNGQTEDFCVKWGPNEDHFSSLVLMRTKSSIVQAVDITLKWSIFHPNLLERLYAGAPIRSRIRDLVPNGTKVPKWSQKSPDFASKSQISDSTFRCCWKEEAHSSKSLLCPI